MCYVNGGWYNMIVCMYLYTNIIKYIIDVDVKTGTVSNQTKA